MTDAAQTNPMVAVMATPAIYRYGLVFGAAKLGYGSLNFNRLNPLNKRNPEKMATPPLGSQTDRSHSVAATIYPQHGNPTMSMSLRTPSAATESHRLDS
jgi:hypothetical protein